MIYEFIITSGLFFIAIGAGAWTVLLANNMSKAYNFNYLKTYLYFLVLKLLFGLYGIIGMVVVKSILETVDTPIPIVQTIATFIPYLGIPFLIAAWYLFIKMAIEMLGKKVSNMLSLGYFAFMIFVLFGYGFLIKYIFGANSEEANLLSNYAKMILIGVELLTLMVALYVFYILGFGVKNKNFRKGIFQFAHINLVIILISMILFYFADKHFLSGLLYVLFFFSGNLIPVLFLGTFLNKYFLLVSENTDDLNQFRQLIDHYQISKREWEVVEKICEGMTNRQVSDTLFISLQTVKDHTHRIYKKTGVKNRVQLVNLINVKKLDFEQKT